MSHNLMISLLSTRRDMYLNDSFIHQVGDWAKQWLLTYVNLTMLGGCKLSTAVLVPGGGQ
jgi:hypothetical protein